jgi:hypothetical protein
VNIVNNTTTLDPKLFMYPITQHLSMNHQINFNFYNKSPPAGLSKVAIPIASELIID